MGQTSRRNGTPPPPAGASDPLPRRDFILLPLISLVTVLALLGLAEMGSRMFFSVSGSETCSLRDALYGYRIKPNCVSHRKAAEGPDVEMAYNDCGYRTPQSCGPKPASTIRIALLGSSTAQGFKAPYDVTLAARTSAALTRMCGRPVEIQNMGVAGYKPLDSYFRADEALAMRPDLVILVIVPYDLEQPEDRNRFDNRQHPERLKESGQSSPHPQAKPRSLLARVNDMINVLVDNSRAVLVAQHFLFQDPATFVRLQLALGDKSDYLRTTLTPNWRDRYRDLDNLISEMADKFHATGVPFLLVFGTELAQADLAHMPSLPPGIDPSAAGRQLEAIAERHGVLFLDTIDAFRAAADPDGLFYTADGHMTGDGHAVFAASLIRRLTQSDILPLSSCASAASASADARSSR